MSKKNNIVVYQAKNGAIKLRGDTTQETLWATRMQMADMFGVNPQAISKHIQNIFKDGELKKSATSSKMELVQTEAGRKVKRKVDFYNLDILISVGYRISSKTGTKFRQWATKTLRSHIVEGYTINPSQIGKNYQAFLQAVNDTKKILPAETLLNASEALDLVKIFASTWFSLDAYDKSSLPKSGVGKKQIDLTAEELAKALAELKASLIKKKEATGLFGQERPKNSLAGIVGNVFQSFGGKDLYPTLEEKAVHLLYFIIKNHPFTDGNKRSGAFAFVWFLRKAGMLDTSRLSPEALTALTLLIAESAPREKERMVGLVLLLLKKK